MLVAQATAAFSSDHSSRQGSAAASPNLAAYASPASGLSPSSVLFHNNSLSSYGYRNAVALANASGTPSKYLYLPNMNPAGNYVNGKYQPLYTGSPAPMGIADYGTAGSFSTTSFEGSISVNNMTPLYALNDAPRSLGIQLNAILTGVSVGGNNSNVYWNQNVMFYSARTHQIEFIDNIWNFTSPGAGMTNSTLSSHGKNGTVVPGSLYYEVGKIYNVTYPFTVSLYLNSTLSNGQQEVFFNYSISKGASSGKQISGSFDYAVFNSTAPVSAPAKYIVDNSKTAPIGGIPYDAEFVIGGPGGGSTTSLYGINASMSLDYLSGSSYTPVKSAYDAGSDTGETANGIAVSWNANKEANLSAGPTMVYGMWGIQNTGMKKYSGKVSPSESFMFVSQGTSFSNLSASWVPLAPDGSYNFTLPDSYQYHFGIFSNWYDPSYGLLSSSVPALKKNKTMGIYTPVYAFSNQQLKDLSTVSTGISTSPYTITGIQNSSILSIFGGLNDYGFPLFSGILVSGTTSNVTFKGMPSFQIQYSQESSRVLTYLGLPDINYLNYEFYNDTNVTLEGSHFISGWFSYTLAGYFPAADVLFWNTTNSLVDSNYFSSMDSSFLIYNSNNTRANNTVWGNYFEQNALAQSSYFTSMNTIGAPTGISMFSSGNLVYNNVFDVYFTAVSPNISIYTGFQTNYTNSWNITREPVSYGMKVNGITLTGGIMDTGPNAIKYQGGNYWWNYVGNGTAVYNASGLIASGGDATPLIPSVYGVTFKEIGLPAGMQWYIILYGGSMAVGSTGSGITFYVPNGTYYVQLFASGYYANQSAGYVVVSGGNLSFSVSFQKLYMLTFIETGLPAGDLWSLSINGVNGSSVSDEIQFLATNGSFSYILNNAGGFHPKFQSGSAVIKGANLTVTVRYNPYDFNAIFTETGLPSGTQWGVFLAGQKVMTSSSSLSVPVSNGTFGYSVIGALGYSATPQYGTLAVNNGSTDISLVFSSINFSLTFEETGLPSGASWSVSMGGHIFRTANTTLTLKESTGNYSYTIQGSSGYSAKVGSGAVDVNANLSVPVTFQKSNGISLFQALDYGLFAASVAILGYSFYVIRKR